MTYFRLKSFIKIILIVILSLCIYNLIVFFETLISYKQKIFEFVLEISKVYVVNTLIFGVLYIIKNEQKNMFKVILYLKSILFYFIKKSFIFTVFLIIIDIFKTIVSKILFFELLIEEVIFCFLKLLYSYSKALLRFLFYWFFTNIHFLTRYYYIYSV
jgi:hypothetical protein